MYGNLAVLLSLFSGVLCAPNHLKTVVVDANQGVATGGLGASASFAGFSASAGLGGIAGGGGNIGAAASAPPADVPAAAAAESSASAGASVGVVKQVGVATHPVRTEPTFFDRIFNIPISILHSVNDHLNTRGAVRKGVVVTAGGAGGFQAAPNGPVAAASPPAGSASASASADASPSASVSGEAGSSSDAAHNPGYRHTASATGVVVAQKPAGFYDSVFNIPISALRSVNQLLNG